MAGMLPETQQIRCLKYPEHGMVSIRKLRPDARETKTRTDADVFEVDCPLCGRYEASKPEIEIAQRAV
jgi:hypothetical protein